MIKTLKMINRVDNSIASNTLIFNLQKIPFVGKIFKDNLYEAGQGKNVLFNIVKVLRFLLSIIKKFIYFGVFFYLAFNFLEEDFTFMDILNNRYGLLVINIYFFLNIILGAIMKHELNAKYTNYSYTCLNYLELKPREYFVSRAFFSYFMFFVAMFIPMFILGKFIGLSALKVIILLLETLSFRIFIDGISLLALDRKNEDRRDVHWFFYTLMIVIFMGLAYGPLYLLDDLTYVNLLFNPLALVLFLILAAIGLYIIRNYKNYKSLKKAELKLDSDMLETKENMNTKKMVLEDKDLDLRENRSVEGNKGYDYLNSIFMNRYSKLFSKRARKISLAAFTIPLLIGIVSYMWPGEEDKIALDLFSKLGIWFFVVYMMAFKDKYTYALFNNIDKSLLPNNWYREPDAILKSFIVRLKTSFALNSIMTFSLMGGLAVLAAFLKVSLVKLLPLFGLIILLTLFYSTHYLTLYYLVQPYTENSDVKSPVYSFFNFIVYMVSYMLMQKGDVSGLGVIIIASVVIVYLIISLILIRFKAKDTFKIRE